ncbi:hypothetical protein GCM10009665_33560 [Kitasatospora nipponensis]|uniref:Helix-turn-helix protein n=1 Tax=Kitasatospora nipponensis TaxID=258049 RepID=A0ABN1WB31_9ACTN
MKGMSDAEFSQSTVQRAWETPEEVVIPFALAHSPGLQPEDYGVLIRLLLRDPDQPSGILVLAEEFRRSGWKMGASRLRGVLGRLKQAGHVSHERDGYDESTDRPAWVFRVYRNPANNPAYVALGVEAAAQVRPSGRIPTHGGREAGSDASDSDICAGQADGALSDASQADGAVYDTSDSDICAAQTDGALSNTTLLHPPHPPGGGGTTSPYRSHLARGQACVPPQLRRGDDLAPAWSPPVDRALDPERIQAATDFLRRLPGRWAFGKLDAAKFAAELLTSAQDSGWQLDLSLRSWLIRNEEGKSAPRAHRALLQHRVRNLELREAVFADGDADTGVDQPAPARPPGPDRLPDWCGLCNNGEEPLSLMMRTVVTADLDSDLVEPCPRCHPRRARTAR